jgi:hypothetical protein
MDLRPVHLLMRHRMAIAVQNTQTIFVTKVFFSIIYRYIVQLVDGLIDTATSFPGRLPNPAALWLGPAANRS